MLCAQNRAEPRAQAVLKKMAEPGAILHLPARQAKIPAMFFFCKLHERVPKNAAKNTAGPAKLN